METSGKHRFWSFPFVWIFILWICRIWGSRSTKLLYQTTRHVHLKKRFIEQKIQFWFPPPMHKSNKLLNTNWTKWVCAGGKNVTSQIKSHSIIVRWNDAPIGHFLANYDNSLSFEYTIGIVTSLTSKETSSDSWWADISPGPATELGLKSVLYRREEPHCNGTAAPYTAGRQCVSQ